MQKILINLYVPGLSQNFDLFVPMDLRIRVLISIMIDGIRSLNTSGVRLSGNEMLLSQSLNAVLDPERKLSEYALQDGDKLILL